MGLMRYPVWIITLVALVAVALTFGCTRGSRTSQYAKVETLAGDGQPMTEQQLSLAVSRFSDSYIETLGNAVREYLEEGVDRQIRRELLTWYLGQLTVVWDISIGPDAELNLLDMMTQSTLTRIGVDEWLIPEWLGERGNSILEAARQGETDIWRLSERVLDREQQQTVRDLIDEWLERHPGQVWMQNLRLTEFAAESDETTKQKVLFLVGSVKVVASQAEEARLLAERAMRMAQRAPFLARLHAQLMLLDLVYEPEIQSLLEDYSVFASALDRTATTFEELPEELNRQRNETIAQIFERLDDQRIALLGDIGETQPEIRDSLVLLQETIEAANRLIGQTESLASRFEGSDEARAETRPFDIREYRETALAVTETVTRLERLVAAIDTLAASSSLEELEKDVPALIGAATGETQAAARAFVNHVFRLGLMLIAAAVVGGLIYRWIAVRIVS